MKQRGSRELMKRSPVALQADAVAGLASMVFNGGAFVCWTFGVWSLTASLNITQSFFLTGDLFSNWIVWFVFGLGLRYLGKLVERELIEHPLRMPKLAWARRSQTVPPDDRTAAAA
jgi:hypothetical protein